MGKWVEVGSYSVDIFIAGDRAKATEACQAYCDAVGLCVTVAECDYVYTGGREAGVRIGLINYPRFPKSAEEIWQQALSLAAHLRVKLDQQSYSVVAPDRTRWVSHREADNPSASS